MIALACFLSSIQFLISSLIQILSLAWKAAIVILASLITIVKKRKNPAKFSLHRCGPKCFLKAPNIHFFKAELDLKRVKSNFLRPSTVPALEAESIGGLGCGVEMPFPG